MSNSLLVKKEQLYGCMRRTELTRKWYVTYAFRIFLAPYENQRILLYARRLYEYHMAVAMGW